MPPMQKAAEMHKLRKQKNNLHIQNSQLTEQSSLLWIQKLVEKEEFLTSRFSIVPSTPYSLNFFMDIVYAI